MATCKHCAEPLWFYWRESLCPDCLSDCKSCGAGPTLGEDLCATCEHLPEHQCQLCAERLTVGRILDGEDLCYDCEDYAEDQQRVNAC